MLPLITLEGVSHPSAVSLPCCPNLPRVIRSCPSVWLTPPDFFFGGNEILGIAQLLGLTWYEYLTTTFETSDGKEVSTET